MDFTSFLEFYIMFESQKIVMLFDVVLNIYKRNI
jgi:hypothetical protein